MHDRVISGSHGNHMIMTSLETMTNIITSSNTPNTAKHVSLKTFEKERCHGDIL